ncbi:MAG: nickel-dependent lactate racemase [Limnochordia bacterium]
MLVHLPYGPTETIPLEIPDGNLIGVLEPPEVEGADDEGALIRQALDNPIGTEKLEAMVRPGMKVAIVISDASRPNVEAKIVPELVTRLAAAGIPQEDLIFGIGTGAHRPATREELIDMLGEELLERATIVNHRAGIDPMADLGYTSQGYPIKINKAIVEADFKIAIGVVLPHPFAGYSGGGKAIAVGVASAETIASTHTPETLEHPNTGLGVLEGNPMYLGSLEMARAINLGMLINATVLPDGRLVDVVAGEVGQAHGELVRRSADVMFKVPFPEPADIVVVSSGYPKDGNLYHGMAEGVCIVAGDANPTPCVRKKGTIILVSPMEEGVYNEVFARCLQEGETPAEVMAKILRDGVSQPGQHRAYGVAKILVDHEVICAQSQMDPQLLESMHLKAMDSAQGALAYALEKHGPQAKVLVLLNSHRLVPVQA